MPPTEPTFAVPPQDEYGANLLPPLPWYHAGWWHDRSVCVAFLTTAVAPPVAGWPVMAHQLLCDTDTVTGSLYGRYVAEGLQPGAGYTASCWVWLAPGFEGGLVGMVFDGFASLHTVNASLGRTGEWQRVWTQTRLPPGTEAANPRLYVIGRRGARLFSCGWKLERG
jgi:hypothetical protein